MGALDGKRPFRLYSLFGSGGAASPGPAAGGLGMFAIVESGGKQYRVAEGDVLRLEKLEAEAGATVQLPVLLLGGGDADGVKVGAPNVDGATVKAEVIAHGRGDKIHVYKFKAKNNYRRHIGHRQPFTEVRITAVEISTAVEG